MVSKERKEKSVFTTGKRKLAVARAKISPGKGIVKVNSIPLDLMNNAVTKMRIQEALIVTGGDWKKFDINLNVRGGGIMGQADAARQAIARGLAKMLGADTRKKFMEYDRYMIVSDSRRTEPHKPPRSSQGPRRYKQRSKR
ncbi:MAG: 30S ribosomal protein S9 [Candidatus Aenigmatarchaeota archaeon]|nr:MAG: 30S ribosomal protein S9 [Candidatus Aenigmarchaeota archaeon]